MASFTEQATLKVVDQSTAQLRKINAELKKLFATAKSLKSIRIDLRVNDKGLTKAAAAVRQLAAAVRTLRSSSVHLRADVTGLAAAQRQIAQLRAAAQRPIVIRTQHAGGGGGVPGGPGVRYGGGGYARTPGRAFLGGVGGGLGVGLGRLNESFGAVALAGYAAARALRAVGEAANARDRAELAVETQTSAAQRAVFEEADRAAKASGTYTGALRYKKDQFNLARASFLGDVGVEEGTLPQSREGELQRAQRADLLARTLYRDVIPGMYARNPKLTQQESQEELKKYVQTLGITTQNMFTKDKEGRLQLSEDYKRVAEGLRLAQIAAPDLTMGQMRTAAAAIKSLGYTATSTQIAEILFNVSAKGQRAGNEAYQMYRAGLGVNDVGKLNTAIENLGLFLPGTAKRGPKTKKHPAGLVQAGTGIPVEFTDKETGETIRLGERPSDWWRAALDSPEVKQKIQDHMVDQAVRGLPKGATKADKEKAAAEARAREPDATVRADFVNRILAGARGTALQGILDAILGGPIAKAGIAQAQVAPGPEEVNRIMTERWSVQASNLGTAVADAAGDLGKLAAEAIGLANILRGMTSFVDQYPLTSGAIAIAAGTAVGVAMLVPAAMLTSAASALIGAAGVLSGTGAAGAAGAAAGAGRWANVMRVGGVLSRVVGGVAVALTAAEVAQYIATRTEEQAKADEARVQAAKDLAQKEGSAARIERERRLQEGVPQTKEGQAKLDRDAATLVQLKAEIERLRTVLDPSRAPPAEVKPEAKPAEPAPATPATIQAAVTQAVKDHLATIKPDTNKPVPVVPIEPTRTRPIIPLPPPPAPTEQLPFGLKRIPLPLPTTITGGITPAETAPAAPGTMAALIPQLAKTSESITFSISSLTSVGNTFATVFQTGATAIGNAGQTAASTLSGAAPSIGAAIGNAAANAIKAATANINVNVNTNVAPSADKGRQAP